MYILYIIDALLLGYFSYTCYVKMKKDAGNKVNYHFWLASLYSSIAFVVFAVGGIFPSWLIWAGIVGMIMNALGINHFLFVPISNWVSHHNYVIAKHIMYLYAATLAGLAVMILPLSYVGTHGIIHWQFNEVIGIIAAVQLCLALLFNFILIGQYLRRARRLSAVVFSALLIAFAVVGLSGTYQYLGDNETKLAISSVLICLAAAGLSFFAWRGWVKNN